MFNANKIYRKYRTGKKNFRIKKKNEISKNQSGDSIEQDINLVRPIDNILIISKNEIFTVLYNASLILLH
jgi:hypothetical protein